MTDDRYPYITSGPQLLNDGLRMLAGAEEVLKRPNPGLDELAAGQLRATIAKARIQAADALGWGTLVAAESEEWGESWRDAIDPTGEIRAKVAEREAAEKAEREARVWSRVDTTISTLGEQLRAPADVYSTAGNPTSGANTDSTLSYPWNAGPLVPPPVDESQERA
ncbi:MAG TPA: hypothetical protein VK034_15290 [Enhygromyxa sp.]|nr:hypothetical protein [Enhygromyxa sp.]